MISVVIPCLNAAADLPGQLKALAVQDWDGDWEVVVADNGSTDTTAQVALGFSDELPAVRIVDASTRRGQAHALNVGIRAARGRSIILADADDEVAPGYLAAMAGALDEHEFVAASYDSESLNPAAAVAARGTPQRDGLLNGYGFLPYAGSGGFGLRREMFDRVGGFDEDLLWLFDVDFCWRAQTRGTSLTFVPDAVMRIRFPEAVGTYRQARNWASVEPVLYRRYGPLGMPRSPMAEAAKGWARAAVRIAQVRQPEARPRYLRNLGRSVGRLRGSVRNRVVFL